MRILAGCEYTFNEQLDQFLELARALARLSGMPALLPVTDIFEANGTAYYVTETISAISLKEFLVRNGGLLSWEQARPLLMPVLTTLSALHEEGVVHRAVSPDTIIIGRDGRARLIGFCVPDARTARTEMSAQLFPGYAAIEQYGFESQQGPWTDVYGFCATLYRVLVGNPPPEATERVTSDRMIIPAKIAQTLPRNVMMALANGLAILAEDRTQDVDQLKAELSPASAQTRGTTGSAKAKGAAPAGKGGKAPKEKKPGSKGKKYALIATASTIVVVIIAVVLFYNFVIKDMFEAEVVSGSEVPPPSSQTVSLLPDPESKEKLVTVPSFVNLTYADIMKNPDYKNNFTFEIVEKTYQDNYARGKVYEQSPQKDEIVKPGQKVTLKVSLGPSKIQLPSYTNMDFNEVYIDLLRKGFLPDNIRQEGKWDENVLPGKVVGTEPASGSSVVPDAEVIIYVNTYTEETSSAAVSSSVPVQSTSGY